MEYELIEELHEDRCALAVRRDGGLGEGCGKAPETAAPIMRWARRGEHSAAQMGEG